MRLSEDRLVERLKIWAPKLPGFGEDRRPAPPVTEEEMRQAEAALGFALPPLLRRLYLEVGNGDFGPRLLPLNTRKSRWDWVYFDSIVTWHVGPGDEAQSTVWPKQLLMICDWGCNIYSCIDRSKPECPVLRSDNSILAGEFAFESPSLHQWLEDWLDGKQLFWLDWDKAEKITFPLG